MSNRYLSNEEIESKARDLQLELWELAGCPQETKKILNAFKPSKLVGYLGYKYIELEDLGDNRFNRKKYETAGTVNHTKTDNYKGTVAISLKFSAAVRNFTAGHEAGHLVLHPDQSGLHRDIPVDYVKSEIADYRETQANKFSSYWLMPGKLVLKEIINMLERIGGHESFLSYNAKKIESATTTVHFDENLSFWLAGGDSMKLVSAEENGSRESALASFRNGVYPSLADIFGVSHTAMAHRIKELGIIIYP